MSGGRNPRGSSSVYVRWGLIGAILFLIGITPLGLEEVPNVVLAGGAAFLLTQKFPTDVVTMLRRRLRESRTSTAGAATARPGERTRSRDDDQAR